MNGKPPQPVNAQFTYNLKNQNLLLLLEYGNQAEIIQETTIHN